MQIVALAYSFFFLALWLASAAAYLRYTKVIALGRFIKTVKNEEMAKKSSVFSG